MSKSGVSVNRLTSDQRLCPFVAVITGTPGVGKTTVARLVAERFPRSAHIEADLLQRMIVSGGQWPSAGTEVSLRQLLLRTSNAVALADLFASAGIVPIVDEVIGLPEQAELLDSQCRRGAFVSSD